jgi:hypothetical protein
MKRGQAARAGRESQSTDAVDAADAAAREVEPGTVARLIVDAREGAVDRAAAEAISKPLGDLAQAFALQAEVLKSVHDNQQRMQAAIDDDKKSEMMLSSTKSLNETFKGVRGTQKELLEELRRERGAKSRWVWAVLVLGLAILGMGLWMWLDRNDGVEERQRELEGRVGNMQASILPRLEDEAKREREEKERVRKELEEARLDERRASDRFESSQGSLISLRAEIDSWKKRAESAESELAQLRELQREDARRLRELEDKKRELDEQVTFYLRKAEAAEKKATRLNDEILTQLRSQGSAGADALAGAPTTPIVDPALERANEIERLKKEALAAAAKTEAEKPAGESPNPVPPTIQSADPAALMASLNKLMSRHKSNGRFRFTQIGGVKEGRLTDVVFEESVPGVGVKKEVSAKYCEIQLSGRADLVEFFFREGTKRVRLRKTGKLGPSNPFYNGEYRDSLLCTNGDDWRKRRWTFLRFE